MFLQLSLDCLECLKKQEVTWDVSLTSFFLLSWQHSQENTPQSLLLSSKGEDCSISETVNIHQILLIWIYVMKKTWELLQHIPVFSQGTRSCWCLLFERQKAMLCFDLVHSTGVHCVPSFHVSEKIPPRMSFLIVP